MSQPAMNIYRYLVATAAIGLTVSVGCATSWNGAALTATDRGTMPSVAATNLAHPSDPARLGHPATPQQLQPSSRVPGQPPAAQPSSSIPGGSSTQGQPLVEQVGYNNRVSQTGFVTARRKPQTAESWTGHNCPPGGHPQARGHMTFNHAGSADPCNGACGPSGPVYPCMPPMSNFGLDAQEFLCDGGDRMPDAAVRLDDKIIGVGLEDTVVKYETPKGTLHVEPSNRVCIYAPRFAAVRRITGALTDEAATGPVAYIGPDGPGNVLAPQPSSAVMNPIGPENQNIAKGPDALRGRDLGVPVDMVNGPVLAADVIAVLENLSVISDGILRDADKPWLAKGADAAVIWSLDQTPQVVVDNIQASVATVDLAVEGITGYELPGGRLRVIKVADRRSANVGDIVTFVIRVDNTGEGKLSNVVLTDNLTTRLEYVPDSQTCTKGVKFETEENEGGSLRLTWKFTDDFEVGEGAIIRFRCKVR